MPLKQAPLLQVCRLVRSESVDVFNKYLSGILARFQEQVTVAEAVFVEARGRNQFSRVDTRALEILAEAKLDMRREVLRIAQRMVERQRRILELEG